MSDSNEITCFIIMPFSKTTKTHTEEYWTKHFLFLKKKIEEIPNIKVHRSVADRGDILNDIIRDLISSNIVVADLTDRNPNVYWELGIRQSFKQCTITIAETRKHIPFDLSTKGVFRYYPNDIIKNEDFIQQLHQSIEDCISSPNYSDSRVLDTISGRGSMYEIIRKDETKRRLDGLISEIEYNYKLINSIKTQCDKNIEFRKKQKEGKSVEGEALQYTSERHRVNCIELLISNRYLDSPISFYEAMEDILSISNRINEGLQLWASGSIDYETWFCKTHDDFIESFKSALDVIKEENNKTNGIF